MFYTIIIFCHDSDLMSPNTSNSFSMQISRNIISVSSRVDKRPSRIKIQTFYHLLVFFTCQQQLCFCVCVCLRVAVFEHEYICISHAVCLHISIWLYEDSLIIAICFCTNMKTNSLKIVSIPSQFNVPLAESKFSVHRIHWWRFPKKGKERKRKY